MAISFGLRPRLMCYAYGTPHIAAAGSRPVRPLANAYAGSDWSGLEQIASNWNGLPRTLERHGNSHR